MVDSTGKTTVEGVSLESASTQLLAQEHDLVVHGPGVASLKETEGESLTLEGYSQAQGSMTVEGNLDLKGAVLYVGGELHVTGAITGLGAVFAAGSITADGGAMMNTDLRYSLVAGGSLTLP